MELLFGPLTAISLVILLWQWIAGLRFPLHKPGERSARLTALPGLTLLKPLKGSDPETERCLVSWLEQDYPGPLQILFGVASATDPVCGLVKRLIARYPDREAELRICPRDLGPNAKVSTLVQLEPAAKYEFIAVSDADVLAPPNCLSEAAAILENPSVGLVNSFYRLANPSTLAMRWEAVAINADFWSQVLQARDLKPIDFALGALMVTRRSNLAEIGGFAALLELLADDYHLGRKIAGKGAAIALSPIAVECWEKPMTWRDVWLHQLRWARTIRTCQPLPYFFSILGNTTLWPLLWVSFHPTNRTALAAATCLLVRILAATHLQARLSRSREHWKFAWLVPIKDLLQAALWCAAFLGRRVLWRGRTYSVKPDGTMEEAARSGP